jgi:dipeptidyl aminopeptidase/acylaminoacyl peptidase
LATNGGTQIALTSLMSIRPIVSAAMFLATAACAQPRPAQTETLRVSSKDAVLAADLQFPAGTPPFPAVVLVHGSGRMTRGQLSYMSREFLEHGIAVVAYDKRGVGGSTGEYSGVGPKNSVAMFDLLSGDSIACAEAIRNRKDIDGRRIGLAGGSQAGWIIPVAATKTDIFSFLVITSGPAVSVGEEIFYSDLAGYDPGSVKGLSDEEIDRRMQQFKGPHGYDPEPVLAKLRVPSIWILGAKDRSIPVDHTIANLHRLRDAGKLPMTVKVLPRGDHSLRDAETHERIEFWPDVWAWLKSQGVIK